MLIQTKNFQLLSNYAKDQGWNDLLYGGMTEWLYFVLVVNVSNNRN